MAQFPHLEEIWIRTFSNGMWFHSFHNRNYKEKHQCLCTVPVEHIYFNGTTWKALPWCAIGCLVFDMGVLNFKDFVQKFCSNLRSTTSRDKVNWMNICWIQTRRDYPHTLNETFDEALFFCYHSMFNIVYSIVWKIKSKVMDGHDRSSSHDNHLCKKKCVHAQYLELINFVRNLDWNWMDDAWKSGRKSGRLMDLWILTVF